MIVLIGLVFLGIWAAGRAKQRGLNQYVFSIVTVLLFIAIYYLSWYGVTYVLSLTVNASENGTLTRVLELFIKISLIALSFIFTKLILDWYFEKASDENDAPIDDFIKKF